MFFKKLFMFPKVTSKILANGSMFTLGHCRHAALDRKSVRRIEGPFTLVAFSIVLLMKKFDVHGIKKHTHKNIHMYNSRVLWVVLGPASKLPTSPHSR